MKVILASSLIVMTAISPLLGQQQLKRRPGTLWIFGPVHTIRDERATIRNANGESVEGPRVLVMTMTYNEDGTRQERTSYHPDGSVIYRIVETYDPDGRILENAQFDGGGILKSRQVSTYDNQKQLVERLSYRGDGSMSSRVVFRREGNQLQSNSVVYDSHGGVISTTTTTGNRGATGYQGESLSYNANGTTRTQSSITNLPDGSQEFKQERSDGTSEREIMRTVEKGSDEQISYNPDGTILSRLRFAREFDSYGNMVKTTHLVAKGDSSTFEPADITYRTLTYYGKD